MGNKRRRVFAAALLLDAVFGDPPNRWHPVAWMGSLISYLRKQTPGQGKFLWGGSISLCGGGMIYLCGCLVSGVANYVPLGWLLEAALLKSTFSIHGLDRAALQVQAALENDDLPEARRLLSWHLVSRDVSRLTKSQVAAAAIESVAENSSDGIIAPWFFYLLGGLPAALAYRYLNTCDSMLGYQDAEREWLGKIPARLDDLLNLIPARLTALLFVLGYPPAFRIWWRDARLTASPNAGHPMSAMAGVLGVELEKVGLYRLGVGYREPDVKDLQRTRHIVLWTLLGAAALLMIGLRDRDSA